MRMQQKTQNHTHQTAEKHKIAHQIAAKNNKKITYQIGAKITN